jgi:Flp pilus assembly protein TadD
MSAPVRSRAWALLAAIVLIPVLGGCQTDGLTDGLQAMVEGFAPAPIPTPTVEQPANVQYHASDEPLRLGLEFFNRGQFGIAERYFRDAVEKSPRDTTAWVGLAATYDRVGRFELADRAYANAIRLGGYSTEILNNQGYSYMLRGNYKAARKKFMQANLREPNNPAILNNLKLLDGSSRAIKRTPDFEPASE